MSLRQGLLRALVGIVACVFLVGGCDEEPKGHPLFGYVDGSGAEVIAPRFLAALPFQGGLAAVADHSGWGYIDQAGRWVIPARFQCATPFSDGRAAVRDARDLWGYIDARGATIVPPQYAKASPFVDGRAFVTRPDGGVQIIDRGGHPLADLGTIEISVPDEEFCELPLYAEYGISERSFTENWSRTREDGAFPFATKSGSHGYMNFRGEVLIEPQDFYEAAPFAEDRAAARKDGKFGFIDRSGKVVVPFECDAAIPRFSHDRTIVGRAGHAELIDRAGRTVADLGPWPWPGLGENDSFENVANNLYGSGDYFADGLMPWPKDGKWGYLDTHGRWAIEPRYDWADPFEDGRASVSVNGIGVVIDLQGRETARPVAPSTWIGARSGQLQRTGTASAWTFTGSAGRESATHRFQTFMVEIGQVAHAETRPLAFSEGLAVVTRFATHRWRRLGEQGQARAEGEYEWLRPVGQGLLAHRVDSKWGLLDRDFRVVAPPRFDEPPEFVQETNRDMLAYIAGRTGCVDRRGHWIALPPGIDRAGCNSSIMWARVGQRMGVVGVDGRWRVAPEHKNADPFGDPARECFEIADDSVTKLRCRSGSGFREIVVSAHCDSPERCLVDVGGKLQRLDPSTLRPSGPLFDEAQRTLGALLAVRQGSHWGAMGPAGELALPVMYDHVGFNVDYFGKQPSAYYVRQGDRWAALNPQGQAITAPIYEEMEPFWGFLRVRAGGKWGLVAGDGTEVARPQFDEIVTMRNDLLLVKRDGRYELTTLNGEPLWSPAPEWLQKIHLLANFSPSSWAVMTTDNRMYVIDRRTHTAAEATAPQGYAWQNQGTTNPAGFEEYQFFSPLEIVPQGSPQAKGLLRYVIAGDDGRPLNPLLFDGADRVEHEGAARYTVTVHGRCGFLDAKGRWLVPMTHDHCVATEDGDLLVADDVLP